MYVNVHLFVNFIIFGCYDNHTISTISDVICGDHPNNKKMTQQPYLEHPILFDNYYITVRLHEEIRPVANIIVTFLEDLGKKRKSISRLQLHQNLELIIFKFTTINWYLK